MHESNESMSLFGNGDPNSVEAGRVRLDFHAYPYFTYEKELARRELISMTGSSIFEESHAGLSITRPVDIRRLRSLTYFSRVTTPKERFTTLQYELEESHRRVSGIGKRQATRYSVHGLHEYKGRFNPQIVRFLLNYLGSNSKTKVLDPFCGSGTTIVEAALGGLQAVGVDANPLASFLSNAKIAALTISAQEVEAALEVVLRAGRRKGLFKLASDDRMRYLRNWFPVEILVLIERLRAVIKKKGGAAEPILLALVSDLLREYSLQEPSDLRIRRRISPFPREPFLDLFEKKAKAFIRNLSAAQEVTGVLDTNCVAFVGDSRELRRRTRDDRAPRDYDLVITSPPYATALPYIDTQRLSLVWLGLSSAEQIRSLEASAVGSREFDGNAIQWALRLKDNADSLPEGLATFCRKLHRALSPEDGFRRRATPTLIYRYFAEMRQVFSNLRSNLKRGARLAFVVGRNQTTLGGETFCIDSAKSLAMIAEDLGFRISEVLELETYQRYGLHQRNSIQRENLTILEWR